MRKSFELLDWMKGHFGTPVEPGEPGILYRFTHGLKETGGVVKVDEGNGLAVNERSGMLEVPVGEHLSYTSQGIDAKEGDTAQKGVVRLSDAITPESTHETAATPQAVKEYVDANAGSGSGGIDMSKDNVFSGTGDLIITSKRSGDAGGIRLTRESDQSAKVFLDLEKDRAVLGCGSSPASFLEGLTVTNNMVAVKSSVHNFVYNNSPVITENTARTPIENYLKDNLTASEGIVANVVPTVGTTIKGVLADEQNLGVVKLTHTVSHGEHPNEAVTPDGVAAYVDAKMADAGEFSIEKATQATPDFKLIEGSMVQSGKAVYGILIFTCPIQKSIANIALLPFMPKSPFTVKVVRMSNNPVVYAATVKDDGTVAFASEQSVQTGTYTVTIAMLTK